MAVKTILAALALDENHNLVAERAIQLANQHGAQLIIVHALQGLTQRDPALPTSTDQAAIIATLNSIASDKITKATQNAVTPPKIIITAGRAHEIILEHAQNCAADLILIGPGTAKNIREKIFGSTADRVVRASSRPVLIVKSPTIIPYAHIVVGVDLLDQSKTAVRLGSQIAPTSVIELIHIVEIPLAFEQAMLLSGTSQADIKKYRTTKMQAARKKLQTLFSGKHQLSPRTLVRVTHGDPANILLKSAQRPTTDLLAIGAQGHNTVARHLLGSVAQKVLRKARSDVLLVP